MSLGIFLGGEGKATRGLPLVGPLGPGRGSLCLLSRSLFLCASFRGIKADTVVTRSPAGQRSDFTIPITMISNDVYLAGSDSRELYTRGFRSPPLCLQGHGCGGLSPRLRQKGGVLLPDTEHRSLPLKGCWPSDGWVRGPGPRLPPYPHYGARGHGGIKRVTVPVVNSEY